MDCCDAKAQVTKAWHALNGAMGLGAGAISVVCFAARIRFVAVAPRPTFRCSEATLLFVLAQSAAAVRARMR